MINVVVTTSPRQRHLIPLIFGLAMVAIAAVLWVVGSFSPNWSGLSSHEWRHSFELIWMTESAIVIAAACCAYWSPRCATALLLPAIVFRIVSLGQFYVPESSFSGHATATTYASIAGLILAVLGFILLALVARPFWGLTRSSLVATMIVFVVADRVGDCGGIALDALLLAGTGRSPLEQRTASRYSKSTAVRSLRLRSH